MWEEGRCWDFDHTKHHQSAINKKHTHQRINFINKNEKQKVKNQICLCRRGKETIRVCSPPFLISLMLLLLFKRCKRDRNTEKHGKNWWHKIFLSHISILPWFAPCWWWWAMMATRQWWKRVKRISTRQWLLTFVSWIEEKTISALPIVIFSFVKCVTMKVN